MKFKNIINKCMPVITNILLAILFLFLYAMAIVAGIFLYSKQDNYIYLVIGYVLSVVACIPFSVSTKIYWISAIFFYISNIFEFALLFKGISFIIGLVQKI